MFELVQVVVTTGAGHYLHELYGTLEVCIELFSGHRDVESFTEFWCLSGYSCGAIVGIANTGAYAADGLHGRVGEGNAIGSESHGFDEVCVSTEATGDDKRDFSRLSKLIEFMTRSGEGRNGQYGNMVPEEQWSCPSSAASAIEDDVVGTGLDSEVDVVFDVIGAEFKIRLECRQSLLVRGQRNGRNRRLSSDWRTWVAKL